MQTLVKIVAYRALLIKHTKYIVVLNAVLGCTYVLLSPIWPSGQMELNRTQEQPKTAFKTTIFLRFNDYLGMARIRIFRGPAWARTRDLRIRRPQCYHQTTGADVLKAYSSVPNKSAGWNIYQKLIKVQAEIIMQVGIFFKT